jgi:hypothetical protein
MINIERRKQMKTINIEMTYDMLPDYMKDKEQPEFISEKEFNVISNNPQFLDDVTLPTWNLIEDTLLKFKN